MIILDENVESHWVNLLKKSGYETLYIAEAHPGISDPQVVAIVEKYKGVLITEDKDFGELVFSHGMKNISVILLRYDQPQYEQIEVALLNTIKDYYQQPGSWFITITKRNVRIRNI